MKSRLEPLIKHIGRFKAYIFENKYKLGLAGQNVNLKPNYMIMKKL